MHSSPRTQRCQKCPSTLIGAGKWKMLYKSLSRKALMLSIFTPRTHTHTLVVSRRGGKKTEQESPLKRTRAAQTLAYQADRKTRQTGSQQQSGSGVLRGSSALPLSGPGPKVGLKTRNGFSSISSSSRVMAVHHGPESRVRFALIRNTNVDNSQGALLKPGTNGTTATQPGLCRNSSGGVGRSADPKITIQVAYSKGSQTS